MFYLRPYGSIKSKQLKYSSESLETSLLHDFLSRVHIHQQLNLSKIMKYFDIYL